MEVDAEGNVIDSGGTYTDTVGGKTYRVTYSRDTSTTTETGSTTDPDTGPATGSATDPATATATDPTITGIEFGMFCNCQMATSRRCL